jgi:hypothetical protein
MEPLQDRDAGMLSIYSNMQDEIGGAKGFHKYRSFKDREEVKEMMVGVGTQLKHYVDDMRKDREEMNARNENQERKLLGL